MAFSITAYSRQLRPLEWQARHLLNILKQRDQYPLGGRDTLLDLNSDGYKDILIEFYALAGTGEKNGLMVYLYDHRRKQFVECMELLHLANPTFHHKAHIVTGYYLGNGGGTATKLRWNGLSLDTLETIDIDVRNTKNQLSFILRAYNHKTKKSSRRVVKVMALPEIYRYGEYRNIIRTTASD